VQKTRAKIREAYSILRLNVVSANENDIIVETCEGDSYLYACLHLSKSLLAQSVQQF
jgi:hypothetical protein